MERLLSVGTLAAQFSVVAFAVCLCAWCCGDDHFHVTGVVLFDGQPVPRGKIYFIPNEAQGNGGAPGYATIRNGAFDTAAPGGKGTAGGPMIVGIEGVDPAIKVDRRSSNHSSEAIYKSLFPHFKTTFLLPRAHATAHFEVPASAAQRQMPTDIAVRTARVK